MKNAFFSMGVLSHSSNMPTGQLPVKLTNSCWFSWECDQTEKIEVFAWVLYSWILRIWTDCFPHPEYDFWNEEGYCHVGLSGTSGAFFLFFFFLSFYFMETTSELKRREVSGWCWWRQGHCPEVVLEMKVVGSLRPGWSGAKSRSPCLCR